MNSNIHELKTELSMDEAFDFRALIYTFWENKFLILIITLVVILVAMAGNFMRVPIYEANTLIQIESKNQGGLGAQQIIFGSAEADATATQIALMRSRVILDPVVTKLGLASSKDSHSAIINNILSRLRIEELGDVNNNSQTKILQISLKDTDPNRLVNILNTITQVTQSRDAERKSLETAKTLKFLNHQLPIVKNSLEKAEAALNQYRATSGKLDIKIESQQLIQEFASVDKQIKESNLLRADLLQKYTLKHPLIIQLDNKILQLRKMKTLIVNQIKALPASDQVAVNLMRDVKVKNDLYLILLNKMQELEVLNAGTLSDVRILAAATLPDAPLSKMSSIILVASLVLGLLLGSVIVLVRKAFSRQVDDPLWVEKNLNITNLTIIPHSKRQAENMRLFNSGKHDYLDILAKIDPHDLTIEVLRSLRTSFQLITLQKHNNIVTFTSVCQGIGKSFVSVNFSCLLGDIGKKILLIDGDLRKGHLYHYFKATKQPGLSEVLQGIVPVGKVIKKTDIENVSFISCGAYPENPAELLTKEDFKTLLVDLSTEYDFIIVDTPPVLAVTDSTIIGSLAATNFVLIGSNAHQPEDIHLAFRRLDNSGVKVAGAIYNNHKKETTVYGSYRYNYYSYYTKKESTASL